MVDHQAIAAFNDWLQIENPPQSVQQAIEIPGAIIQADDEFAWFGMVCEQIQAGNLKTLQQPAWSEIIPKCTATYILMISQSYGMRWPVRRFPHIVKR